MQIAFCIRGSLYEAGVRLRGEVLQDTGSSGDIRISMPISKARSHGKR